LEILRTSFVKVGEEMQSQDVPMELGRDKEVASDIGANLRAFAPKDRSASYLIAFLTSITVLLTSVACQGQTPGTKETIPQSLQASSVGLNPASLILELNRAVVVFKQGLKENWRTRDQYLSAFEKTPVVDSRGRSVTDAKDYVACAIDGHFRTHQLWDEGLPIEVEVHRTISDLIKLRNEAGQSVASNSTTSPDGRPAEFHPPLCMAQDHWTPVLAAGLATSMLKTKVDPIYPAGDFRPNVTGTVVLQATIGSDGHVTSLRAVNGPALLYQSALEAVRQWTYQPYLLNGQPIEVETTINVTFPPNP
jgi:TonB family protein